MGMKWMDGIEGIVKGKDVKGFDKASELEKDSSQTYSKEGKTMKYRAIKLITLQAVYNVGDKSSLVFREIFDDLLRWCFFKWGMTTQFFVAIDFRVMEPELEKRPKWRDFLLKHGFIEEVEKPFCGVGDHFRHRCGNKHMIARVGADTVQMIRIDGMLFYGGPAKVGDPRKITEEEFTEIVAGNECFFTKIEEGE